MKLIGTERVMVCPLGWGLGHASRMVPVINNLLQKGCTVIVAADLLSIEFLKPRIEGVEFIHFPSFNIRFSKGRNQLFALFLIAVKVMLRTITERRDVKKLIKKHRVNLIISDNRYGLHSVSIPSIIVTHQLSIRFPKPFGWLRWIGERYVKNRVEKFTECWVPDNPAGFSVSGELSQPLVLPINVDRIGLLSRFSRISVDPDTTFELAAIVSGPSPQREIFEQQIISLAQRLNLKTILFQGNPQLGNQGYANDEIHSTGNATDQKIAGVLMGAKYIICRSGYSTVMDLIALNRSALLIPTPGQTEQEYLARHLAENGNFCTCKQEELKNISIDRLNRTLVSMSFLNLKFFPLV